MDALIGHTGFVGSNLKLQQKFDAEYRSTDIAGIDGQAFNRVVCAGVSAVKWWANQNPREDLQKIEHLMHHLDQVRAERFILISTIDVYGSPIGVTESDAPVLEGLHPYGLHRAMLEDYVRERFPVHHIIRLPALFGRFLKKNAIYDLMHDNRLEMIPPDGSFQWYPLARLAEDLRRTETARLSVVNLATEPVTMRQIQQRYFPAKRIGDAATGAARYDMRTRYDALFGGKAGYILDAPAILDAIGDFLTEEAA